MDLAVPATVIINRGTEPSLIELLVSDDDDGGTRFDKSKNPVTLEISAPDKYGNPVTLELKKWHITFSQPAGPGIYKVILEDNRITARRKRVTVGFNVQVPGDPANSDDPKFREDTLDGDRQWTCLDAAIKAIKLFGLKYKRDKRLSRAIRFNRLPINLGNSAAGGFVSAQWDYMLPLLLDPIHCDPVINADGSVSIIDRATKASKGLQNYSGVEGSIKPVDKHWSKPKKITLEFETRISRQFNYEEGNTVVRGEDIEIEMVIGQAGTNGTVFGFTEFYDEVLDREGISRNKVLNRWLKPRVVETDTDNDDATVLARKDESESLIRSAFRSLFRIVNDEGLQGMADLQIGHLGWDGSTRTTRSTYMPYAFIHKFTRVGKGAKLEQYWETVISTDVGFTFDTSAPFAAQLATNDDGEILLFVTPESTSGNHRTLIPGHMVNPMRVGDAIDIIDEAHVLPTQGQTKLKSGWLFYTVYHGLLLKDRPDLGIDRIHKETRTGFADGEVDEVSYRVSDMTANYGYANADDIAQDRLTLLNEDELAERSNAVLKQVRRNFSDGDAGVYGTAGLDAIVNGGYWVTGDIHSMTIILGAKRPHSVEAKWVVMPEVRPVYANRMNLQGLPVRLIR